jgi:hypothetical protein
MRRRKKLNLSGSRSQSCSCSFFWFMQTRFPASALRLRIEMTERPSLHKLRLPFFPLLPRNIFARREEAGLSERKRFILRCMEMQSRQMKDLRSSFFRMRNYTQRFRAPGNENWPEGNGNIGPRDVTQITSEGVLSHGTARADRCLIALNGGQTPMPGSAWMDFRTGSGEWFAEGDGQTDINVSRDRGHRPFKRVQERATFNFKLTACEVTKI